VVTVTAGSDANQLDREHCMIANYLLPSVSRDFSLIFVGLTGVHHTLRYLLGPREPIYLGTSENMFLLGDVPNSRASISSLQTLGFIVFRKPRLHAHCRFPGCKCDPYCVNIA
jgi:hypothetical protein